MAIRCVLTVGFAALCMSGIAQPCRAQALIPGRIYSNVFDGLIEWNTSLEEQRHIIVPGVVSTTGLVINNAGNAVTIARYQNQARLVEISGAGQVLQTFELNMGALLGGSQIDYDRATGRYLVADDEQMRLFSPTFQPIDDTGPVFSTVFGVAFGPDGFIYASESDSPFIRRFNGDLQQVSTHLVAEFRPLGIEFANDGDLLIANSGTGSLSRWDNPPNGPSSPLLTGLGFGGIKDVDQLPDGRILTIGDFNTLRLYTESGILLDSGTAIERGYSVTYYIPAPSAATLLLLAGVLASRRRRAR